MFGFFKKKEKKEENSLLIPEIVQDVEKLTNERELLISWINYLKTKDLKKDSEIRDLGEKISYQKSSIEAMKDQITDSKEILKQLKDELKAEIDQISKKIGSFPDQVRTKSGPKSEPRLQTMERAVVAQARSRKKDYVLSVILHLIGSREFTTKQLEIVVVNEKELCGRTAFYDYLKELKNTNKIKILAKGNRRVLAQENMQNRFVSEPNSD